MGGPGSGRFFRQGTRKATVEESLALAITNFKWRFQPSCGSGTITWSSLSGNKSSVGFVTKLDSIGPICTLSYQWQGTEEVEVPIRLQSTPTQFGGIRWWFTCPLSRNGVPCDRRTAKVYLPPGGKYFGCRICHDLTYRSAQEAHRDERIFGAAGLLEEWPRVTNRRIG